MQLPFDPDIIAAIGWSLIHFIWQGSLLLLLLRIILAPCQSAVIRYNWALVTLGLMLLSPIATFIVLRHSGSVSAPILALLGAHGMRAVSFPAHGIDWVVLCWLFGVMVLSLRVLVGFGFVEKLRRRGTIELPPEIRGRFEALGAKLSVLWPVRYLESISVSVPAVVGWFRPVVLIPAGSIFSFTSAQLDALVAHELAHIKRLDPFVNMVQIVVETLLFYNPAVWRTSRIIREEREACCDDVAVSVCGNAMGYARALVQLGTIGSFPVTAMAANGGTLKIRVARLLSAQPPTTGTSALAPVMISALCLIGCIIIHGPADIRRDTFHLEATITAMADQLDSFASDVSRSARKTKVPNIAGAWETVVSSDLSKKIIADVRGGVLKLKTAIDTMTDQFRTWSS